MRNVPMAESGRGYGDLVLQDGEPKGTRSIESRQVSVLDEQQLLTPGRLHRFRVTITAPTPADLEKRDASTVDDELQIEDWTSSLPVTHYVTYSSVVILSFRDKRTRDFADGKRVKAFDGIRRAAEMKLDQVEAATSIRDLALYPATGSRPLKGLERVSTVSGSTTNGACASSGVRARPDQATLRSWTITRRTQWHAHRYIPANTWPSS